MHVATEIDDRAAFLERYDETVGVVFAYLYRACHGERGRAEDLLQETYTSALLAWDRGDTETITTSWLLAIARNKMIDSYRKLDREARGVAQLQIAQARDATEREADRETIRACLRELPAMQRAVITLRFVDDLSLADVAKRLGKRVGAIDSLQRRALAALRIMLEENHDEY